MGTLNDLSQLKYFKPATPKPTPAPPPPASPTDRALAGAASSVDYFSSLLGGGEKTAPCTPSAKPRRTTVVTPATIARVREEQAADARAAERAAFQAREAELRDELDAQTAACESFGRNWTRAAWIAKRWRRPTAAWRPI